MKTLRVLGGGAAQGLVEALRPAFEAKSGCRVDGTFGAVGAMRERLLNGEAVDLMILSRALIDGLARDGHVATASVTDIGAVETAVAVRNHDARPDVGNADALRAALLAADEIHFPDPKQATAGIHFAKVLSDLGIGAEVAGRLRTAPNGATAMRALGASTGKRPIGCTQATEILSTPGIALVASLPPGCDLATVYTCGITAKATAQDEAANLIAILTARAAGDTRRRLGFV